MKVLAINAGSSSLKFMLLAMPSEEVLTSGIVERIGSSVGIFTIKVKGVKLTKEAAIATHKEAVEMLLVSLIENKIIAKVEEIEGVGHRVVQGGEAFKTSVVIDDQVVKVIEDLSDLAPLHNPANLIGINTFRNLLKNVINVAVFDNAFHSTMQPETYLYGTPYQWYRQYKVRKYGFHGTSHQYVSQRASQLLNKKNSKIIVCHLGNGASIAAIKNGQSIDTSMGLTPLEGIPMGTRSGSIDAGIIEYIANKENLSIKAVTDILNKKSGYLGISEYSNDARDIEAKIKQGDPLAKLAFDIQTKRIADYIGAYYLQLGGLDALCFTAGIGENSALIRKGVLNRLKVLKVKWDEDLNSQTRGQETLISTPDSKVKVWVIPTNEEVMIARDVYSLAQKS
ncbi:MAG: acetate kinase [Acholeplasmatales bacterium]|jgi:acetate kinase|nr:acetate kinase [Acholeplasmatales bacterium]